MPLKVFEAKPDRVVMQGSNLTFDSDNQYVYSSTGSTIKFTNDPTIKNSSNNLTYHFDGGSFYVNSDLPFTPYVENLSVG
jgi:hypothetical protein